MRYSVLLSFLFLLAGTFSKAQTKSDLKEVNRMLELISKGSENLHKSTLDSWTDEMRIIGQRNQHRVDSIYALYGWLKPPLVSKKASRAFFDILLYSSVEKQEEFQNEAYLAAQAKIIKSGEYYLFVDRLRVGKNKYQIFGTQGKTDDAGNFYFIPVDTTLINNRKLPILPPGEYIYFSNPKQITLFIHVFTNNQKKGVAEAQIYLDDSKVGETNSKGFFQLNISKRKPILKLTVRKGNKISNQKIEIDKDFDWIDQFIEL